MKYIIFVIALKGPIMILASLIIDYIPWELSTSDLFVGKFRTLWMRLYQVNSDSFMKENKS